MKKLVMLAVLAVFGAGVGIALAETDYPTAREVVLIRRAVTDLQSDTLARADGVSTSFDMVISGVTNLVTFEDGQLISASPH